jgi:hypothetical protein
MGNDGRRCLFRSGEVVYFHHLHTRYDLIKHELHSDGDGRSWCRVEGKPRPMLILRRCRRLLVDTARSTGRTALWRSTLCATPPRAFATARINPFLPLRIACSG